MGSAAHRKRVVTAVLLITAAVLFLVFLVYKYISDNKIDHLQNLGDLNYINENYSEALKDYSELMKLEPNNMNVKLCLGKTYLRMGDTDKGVVILREILNSDKSDSIMVDSVFNAVSQQAKILYNDSDMNGALNLTKFALEIKKNDEDMVLQIAQIYLQQGNIDEAEKYAEIMKSFPDTDKYKQIMAGIYTKKADQVASSNAGTAVNYFLQAAAIGYDLSKDSVYKNAIQKVAQGLLPQGAADIVPAYAVGDVDNDKTDEIAIYDSTNQELLLYKYNLTQYQQVAKIGNDPSGRTLTSTLGQIVIGRISPKLSGIIVDCSNYDGSAYSDIFTFDGTKLTEVHSFSQPFAALAKDVNKDGIYETGDCRYGTSTSTAGTTNNTGAASGTSTTNGAAAGTTTGTTYTKLVDWYQLDNSLNTKLISTEDVTNVNKQ